MVPGVAVCGITAKLPPEQTGAGVGIASITRLLFNSMAKLSVCEQLLWSYTVTV